MSKETLSTLTGFDVGQAPVSSPTSRMSVDDGLRRLDAISHRLRTFKTSTVMMTLLTLVFTMLTLFLSRAFGIIVIAHINVVMSTLFLLYCAVLPGILLLFLWERLRVEGKMLFEEISDELEWHHRTFKPRVTYSETTPEPVNLGIRVSLREFLDASDMPLIPGPFGAAWYLAFYIGCMILGTVLSPMIYFR